MYIYIYIIINTYVYWMWRRDAYLIYTYLTLIWHRRWKQLRTARGESSTRDAVVNYTSLISFPDIRKPTTTIDSWCVVFHIHENDSINTTRLCLGVFILFLYPAAAFERRAATDSTTVTAPRRSDWIRPSFADGFIRWCGKPNNKRRSNG